MNNRSDRLFCKSLSLVIIHCVEFALGGTIDLYYHMLMQNKRQFYKLGAPTVPQQPSHTSGRLVPHTSPSGVKI